MQAQDEGAQKAIAALQDDLVGVLRDTMGDEALHAPVQRAIADVDGAVAIVYAAADGPFDTRAALMLARLAEARASLVKLLSDRGSAEATLAAIQSRTRQGAEVHANLAHEVAEQRAGLGGLYAELAADAAKSGDLRRAQRLLATAMHLDPANARRYQTTTGEER